MSEELRPVRFCLNRYAADLTPRQTAGTSSAAVCSMVMDSVEPETITPYTRLDAAMEALSYHPSRLTSIPGRSTTLTHAEVYAVDEYAWIRTGTHMGQIQDDRNRRK